MRTNRIIVCVLLGWAILAGCCPSTLAQEKKTHPSIGTIERLDPRFDELIPRNAVLEKLAEGFDWSEGPVWIRDEGHLLFSDIPANRIFKWSPGGVPEVWREPSGNSNGLTIDRRGYLIACEHGNRRVSRTESDGTVVTLADRYDGGRLNSPNDVVVKSNGVIYFTDPPYGIQPEEAEQSCNGVFRYLPDGNLERLLEDPSYEAPETNQRKLVIDAAYVHERLDEITESEDLSRYIL